MWLLPLFPGFAAVALKLYFRVSRGGFSVPAAGPALLVANHPNSLMDPALVVYAARRPVRFLAKSTLFHMPVIGWLVKSAGSIPVFRRQDDPAQLERNMEMFAAVHAALAGGAAVGVFPEGISHSEPALQTLRTGAARIALGAAALTGSRFPIVPIGLVYRDKRVFRSRAHVIVGQPVSWDELAGRAEADVEAVRILTGRIEAALRQITVNLEEWEDAPLVEAAEAVYAAEFGLSRDPVERITRMRLVTETLKELRRSDSSGWFQLAEDLRRHTRILKWYGFSPRSLHMQTGAGKVIGWSVRRLPLALVAASGVWLIGAALFWLPYTVTGYIGRRARQSAPVLESTAKFLGGGVVFILWICLLSAAVALAWNTRAGVLTLLILPPLALATLQLREILSRSVREARRFLRIKGSRAAVSELRERQKELAQRLDNLRSAAPR